MAKPQYDDREAMAPPPDHRWHLLLEQIPVGARVLELGCGRGYAAVAMAGKGCTVVGIERDADAAAEARRHCDRVLVGDVSELIEAEEIARERFDVIVAADVLEHLVDPVDVLRRCRRLLGEGGFILASLPNATHAAIILEMCEGRLPWADEGLLDRTHLHQFGEDSALDLFERAGYRPLVVGRRRLDPRNTELKTRYDHLSDEVLAFLDRNPNADTYQFIIRADLEGPARPENAPFPPVEADPSPHEPLRSALVREVTDLREELGRYHVAALSREREIARLSAQVNEQATEIGRYHVAALSREREIARLSVQLEPLPPRPRTLAAATLRALYVTSDWDGPGRYRCSNAVEQLRAVGADAAVRSSDDPLLLEDVESATVVVLFRLPWSDRVARLTERARARGLPIVFDTDDLVFDPDLIESLSFLDRLPPGDRDEYADLLPRIHRTFGEADHVIAATPALALHARSLGKSAVVHPNLASPADVRRSSVLRRLRRLRSPGPWIGYGAGSFTHDDDLAHVGSALAKIFERRSDVRLMIGGFVNSPRELDRFADRIIRLPYLDHAVYGWALARCRVLLSPAAVTNAFANAKSPMKLIEGGLLDVPTIATPTDSYRALLVNGWNGWLARSEEDWRTCLGDALAPECSARVGSNARRTVHHGLTFPPHAGRLYRLLGQVGAERPRDGATPARWRAVTSPGASRGGWRGAARRLRQRWSLLRRGDVGAETIPSSSADWWRASEASFLDPPLFAAFLERSDGAWSVEGWVVSGDARRKASGSYESSGADPGLLRGELALDPASRRFLLVRQRTEARAPSPHAQLFFSNLEGPFSEPASLRFPLVADGSWRTYVLDLADTSWPAEGRITALRYDPLESRGSFDLEVLALLPETPELAAFASGARRARLARRFLRGHGAEFGALQNPLPLPENAHAFYVDALTHATARRHYPELDGQPLVRPGIVSNVEHLALRSGALDFAIANHLLEHAKDPIGALQELVRAVRPGGVVFASVPDVGNPLDRLRTVTPTEHLIADHEQRRDRSADDLAHYREAIASGHPEMASAALEELIRERIAIAESIHFHTFDEVSFRWLLDRVAADVEVEHFVRSPMGGWDEYIAILRRRRHTERAGT